MLNRFNAIRTSQSRTNIVIRNMGASLIIRGISLLLGLLTIPAYLRFFEDQNVLGVWFTTLSVLSWILNFDLGLGNGLRNRLAEAIPTRDADKLSAYISSAYVATVAVVAVLALLAYLVVGAIDWNSVLNVSELSINSETLTSFVSILTLGTLLQFQLRLISSVLYAIQKSALPALLNLSTTAGLLLFVSIVDSGSPTTNLLLLATAHAIAVNVPLLAVTIVVFSTTLRSHRPRLRHFTIRHAADVTKLGGTFLLLQITYMLINNTNPFLIAWLSSPSDVVDFQIYSRPFLAISSIFAMALTPIWSAVTDATSRNDFHWIKRLHKRLAFSATLVTLGLVGFAPLLQPFVDIWLGERTIAVDLRYAFAFAASASVYAWSVAITSVVNGTGRLKLQAILMTVGVPIKLAVAISVVQMTGEWIWIVVSDVVALLPYLIIQQISLRKYFGTATTNSSRENI